MISDLSILGDAFTQPTKVAANADAAVQILDSFMVVNSINGNSKRVVEVGIHRIVGRFTASHVVKIIPKRKVSQITDDV
jgi:hypothetical protein